ncbi:MAG: 50S ribosomal protein L18 [Proteobacteria bacterium]|nr:50S ribosomal protein L18 [Pseudomonadota bacterium]
MKTSQGSRKDIRKKRKIRIRKKIFGTQEKPRLCVFRSASHVYAQIIDDTKGETLTSASSLEKEFDSGEKTNKTAKAVKIGKAIAERALEKGIKNVVFDRNGFLYHGRIKAVSEGAREAGLVF